jgi:2,4-dienoyl-CoA reductase-like NADH-dependent reductase (Old Yellow Enzyme family)/NADPH-dependent 2,4-dienoyl-CoA reductase/sulfur reductase-like enzyme
MAYDHLLSPIKIGSLEIKNRVVLSPMNPNLYRPVSMWGGEDIRYFVERVRGEVGLVVSAITMATDLLSTDYHGRQIIGIYNDDLIPMQARFVKAIHDEGGKVFCQLASFGGKYGGRAAPTSMRSANYIPPGHMPEELTKDEIWQIIEDFGKAAGRAAEAGYDGIDIHGCHSYLIGQFTSEVLNKRTDQWGGSFENRMKFGMEVYKSIKASVGEDFPLGVKISTWEDFPGGIRMDEARKIARKWAEAGILYINASSTNTTIERLPEGPYPSVPSYYVPRNTLIPLAQNVREAVKGTQTLVMGTGSIVDPGEADKFIEEGTCDMVSLGRTLLADAHWTRKVRVGEPIRPCIRCNVCHHQIFHGEPIKCSVNPYLIREAQEPLQPAATRKKVMVVGSGPAGVSAALAASGRGHDVTLHEKTSQLGGMVFNGSRPNCKEDVRPLVEYYEKMLGRSDVKLKLNSDVTPEVIRDENADALVIAVGGQSSMPEINGIESSRVVAAVDALRQPELVKGDAAVVIGGGDVGCETACFLADRGLNVTIVEILPELMMEQEIRNVKMLMYPLLKEKGIEYYTSTTTELIHDLGIDVDGPQGRWSIPADTVVIATGIEPRTVLAERLRLEATEVYIVGDCDKPGRIVDATYNGDQVGRRI